MHKILYIADTHFYHKSLLDQMDMRGFENVEAMNEHMIAQWNKKVHPSDEVIVLGDFSMGKPAETEEIIKRLNGKIHLIRGNHDRFLDNKKFDSSLFAWVEDYKEIKDNGRRVVLSHYPMPFYNGQFLKMKKSDEDRTYMLYGHVHNSFDEVLMNRFVNIIREEAREVAVSGDSDEENVTLTKTPCQMINCFCMFSDYMPLTLDEWIEVDKRRRELIQ